MDYSSTEKRRRMKTGICLALILMVWTVFSQTLSFDFVNYDDDRYVYGDPLIYEGVSRSGLHRILTQPHSSNWHPLTSLSHMLDCQLHALNPAGHHLTNMGLHTATVLLLFLVFSSMTGSIWRSALVAAIFAIHPLRAESVAWISERKDVLSGLFFMLTLGAYLRYTRRPFSLLRYLPVLLLFAFGLLSKPMLVTTPFLLLLLDGWPLKRFQTAGTKRAMIGLFAEKLPFLLLSLVSCAITIRAQQGAISAMQSLPFLWRIQNAVISYTVYIKQFILPTGLAALYPLRSEKPSLQAVLISLTVLAAITWLAVKNRRNLPCLLTGWLWYLGMLVPVIGILQVGSQAHADRYTYLPHIGLAMAIIWPAGEWAVTRKRRIAVCIAACAVLSGLIPAARLQVSYWRNSFSLWNRTIRCTQNNPVAHSNLGVALFIKGRTSEAISQFEESLRLEPRRAETQNNLAVAYADEGRYPEAVAAAQRALALAETQCTPAFQEEIRKRLEIYRAQLRDQKNSPTP